MRLKETLALTPTLSPRRGRGIQSAREFSCFLTRHIFPELPVRNSSTDLTGCSPFLNQPTPDLSQEGSKRSSAPCQFPSREGLGAR